MHLSRQADPQLVAALNRALEKLKEHEPGSKEYDQIMDQIVKLHKMKDAETSTLVNLDTLIVVGANILGIVMVLYHEHGENIITSKAWNNILKPRA